MNSCTNTPNSPDFISSDFFYDTSGWQTELNNHNCPICGSCFGTPQNLEYHFKGAVGRGCRVLLETMGFLTSGILPIAKSEVFEPSFFAVTV